MAKKYYAVAKGKTPGIYLTWPECEAQVSGFPGAVYKSFSSLETAKGYMAEQGVAEERIEVIELNRQMEMADYLEWGSLKDEDGTDSQPVSGCGHLVAYVDGSYDHSQLMYAYGCALVLEDEVVTLNGSDNKEEYVGMRNVAGEILGSEKAIVWAIEHGYKSITIYYDYAGIEKWANGEWKTNKTGTQKYKKFVEERRREIEIAFCKVEAHTGVTYNEMADKLAKEALGLV